MVPESERQLPGSNSVADGEVQEERGTQGRLWGKVESIRRQRHKRKTGVDRNRKHGRLTAEREREELGQRHRRKQTR